MATFRFKALEILMSRKPVDVKREENLTSDYYGMLVFDRPKMKKYLSKDSYKGISDAIDNGTTIDRKIADQVAIGMKAWAIENGATHYTHWFHPLTDGTAEKHDAFIDHSELGGVVESFPGKLLAQQEPDALSLLFVNYPKSPIDQIKLPALLVFYFNVNMVDNHPINKLC